MIAWDPQPYSEGISNGVAYLSSGAVPWNGLISVVEKDSTDVDTSMYYDGAHRIPMEGAGDFLATMEVFTYPEELDPYLDRSQRFDFSYKEPASNGYRLHLVYNATASFSSKSWGTETSASSASTFSMDVVATPESITWSKPGAHIVVNLIEAYPEPVADLESILYGVDDAPRMPRPAEVVSLFESYVIFRISYNGDGTWTAEGPDDMIKVNADGTFELTSPSVFRWDENTFVVRSI